MSKAALTALPFPIQRALAYQELFELLGYDMAQVTIAFVDLEAITVPKDEKALVAWLEVKDKLPANNFVCFCGSVSVDWVSMPRWEHEVADVWDSLTAEERGDHRRLLLPAEEVFQLVQALVAKDLPPPRLLAEGFALEEQFSAASEDQLN